MEDALPTHNTPTHARTPTPTPTHPHPHAHTLPQGLDDIEFVHLERTQFGSKSFDIVIVPKDYKKCEKIESIDIKFLDTVKEWLRYCVCLSVCLCVCVLV